MNRMIAAAHLWVASMAGDARPWARGHDRRDGGATSAEYAIIIAGIAVVIVVAVTLFGASTKSLFDRAATGIPSS